MAASALDGFGIVLTYALLPILGNWAGGALAERVHITQRALSLALHVAAGVVVGIVAIELMPQALAVAPAWLILLAFVGGGLFFVLLDHVNHHVAARFGGEEAGAGDTAAFAIFLGVALDLFSDGIMIGAGASLSLGLGLLLAVGQVPADIPEGFATVATFKRQGVSRRKRLLLLAALALPILLGAGLGYFLLRGRPPALQTAVLAFTAGALMTLVLEEIVPEAHTGKESRVAALYFLGGFALFFAVATFLG